MTTYRCDRCEKIFDQLGHYSDHIKRKKPCEPVNVIVDTEEPSIGLEHDMEIQRELIRIHLKDQIAKRHLVGKELFYSNQIKAAEECIKYFQEGKKAVILIAQPGVGKTATAHKIMCDLGMATDSTLFVEASNMAVLSGMNDLEWQSQFKESVLKHFQHESKFIHRGNMERSVEFLKKAKFIIDDECHIAADPDMVVSKVLGEAGILDITTLVDRGVKMLPISATPEAVAEDLKRWGNLAARVILEPGPDYKGFQVMMAEKRIRSPPDISTYEKALEFLRFLQTRYEKTTKKYFPMRITSAVIRSHIERAAATLKWAVPIIHDSAPRVADIDEMMRKAPTEHSIIFIKNFWRASKRLEFVHVGASYESSTKGRRNTSVTAQALTARFCNNYKYSGDQVNINFRPLHFCDVGAINQYIAWVENGYDYRKAAYTSTKLTSRGDGRKPKSKPSKVHEENVTGLDKDDASVEEPIRDYELSTTFPSSEKAKQWFIEESAKSPSLYETPGKATSYGMYNSDGTTGKTHIKYRGGLRAIQSDAETRKATDLGWGVKSSARIIPVFTDAGIGFIVIYKLNKKATESTTNTVHMP